MRGWARAGLLLLIFALALSTRVAAGQSTEVTLGAQDSIFDRPSQSPIMYETSYDRDVSSGTWTQTLSYNVSRGRLSFAADGNYTSIDLKGGKRLGNSSGTIGGRLSYLAARRWTLGLEGHFNKLSSEDFVSNSNQRQDRLKITSQYALSPLSSLNLQAGLSSEFQQDHTLSLRPLGVERLRLLPVYDAAGESVGVDSVFIRDQRDSTFMTGRQDGASGQVDWQVSQALRLVTDASGSRIRPTTKSFLRDFGRTTESAPIQLMDRSRFESPNDNTNLQTKLTFLKGTTQSTLTLKRFRSNQQYFERLLRGQEHVSIDQRSGAFHLERLLVRGAQFIVDGVLDRRLSEYALRSSRTNLLSGRSLITSLAYNPSSLTRGAIDFSIDTHKNSRQASANGTNLTRFLQGNAAHRLSDRLSLDASGNVSLTRYEYVDSVLDQDNVRTYSSIGGSYRVSPRCSTMVHFSASRNHVIAIDPSRSGNNNIQSTYQMDAVLRARATQSIVIDQRYLLNAVYQIYDASQAESKNVLSRIRRIDTTITDSMFTFAVLQLTHNFLFRDSGSFSRPPGADERLYRVGSETYQQTLSANISLKPGAGVSLFATQSLGNTRTRFPRGGTELLDNRWTLTAGGTIDRPLWGNGSVRGTVQHIDAYTERRDPGDALRAQNDWIAGVTFQKEF